MWPNEIGSRAFSDFKMATCLGSYKGYHRWGRPHFITQDKRMNWIRFCRYCNEMATYNLDISETGKLVLSSSQVSKSNQKKPISRSLVP